MTLHKLKQQFATAKSTFILIFKSVAFSYRANPKTVIGIFVAMGFFSIFGTVENFAYSRLIDGIINTLNTSKDINSIIIIFVAYVLVQLLTTTENSVSAFLDQYNYLLIQKRVRMVLLDKLSELDFYYFENSKYQDLINNVRENSFRVVNFIDIILWFFRYTLTLAVTLGVILNYSVTLAIIVIVFSIPRFVVRMAFGKRNYGLWDSNSQTRRDYNDTQYYLESERYLSEVRSYNLIEYLKSRVNTLFDSFLVKQIKLEKKRFVAGIFADCISIIGFGLTVYTLTNDVIKTSISIGLFSFYLSTIGRLAGTIDSIIRFSASLFESSLYVSDFFKFLELPVIVKNGKIDLVDTKSPLIEFRNISFKYPNSSQKVFDNFSLKIMPGEKIAIVGENGAGKSTLVKLLQRFYDVDGGEILINGLNIKELDKNSWYRNISVLGQEFNKYHFDAKTNIAIGNLSKINDQDQIERYAKVVGANSFIEKYEKKYEQILSKHYPEGIEPSLGQWQKIALARSLMKNSSVLILDEPTSAIDPKAEAEIFEQLMDYAKDRTVIIISHRFSTVRNADRIFVLAEGKILEEGSHSELISKNGIYKEAYDLQKKGYLD